MLANFMYNLDETVTINYLGKESFICFSQCLFVNYM